MLHRDFEKVAKGNRQKAFNKAFDRMISDIWFVSEAESIKPENVEKSRKAFAHFLEAMNWKLPQWCFEELLKEKTGEFATRADGKTPNWYHEFRQCLYFLSMVREGLIKEEDIHPYGGSEVAIAILLRHDSWEDLGQDRIKIYTPLERNLHQLANEHVLTPEYLYEERLKSVLIVEGVDLLTRKTPVLDENGIFVRKDNGKFLKQDRYAGQLHLYYNQILKSPLTAIGKFFDGIEGMSTRVGVLNYSVDDDRKYTNERRMLYGRRPLDKQAIEKYPFLKQAIRTADSMLGILLVKMETLNDYAPDMHQNPQYAIPMNIDKYESDAPKGFKLLPAGFHPIYIAMERMHAKALRENDGRVDLLIKNALLPSLITPFPKILYPQAESRTLPDASVSDPNKGWKPNLS